VAETQCSERGKSIVTVGRHRTFPTVEDEAQKGEADLQVASEGGNVLRRAVSRDVVEIRPDTHARVAALEVDQRGVNGKAEEDGTERVPLADAFLTEQVGELFGQQWRGEAIQKRDDVEKVIEAVGEHRLQHPVTVKTVERVAHVERCQHTLGVGTEETAGTEDHALHTLLPEGTELQVAEEFQHARPNTSKCEAGCSLAEKFAHCYWPSRRWRALRDFLRQENQARRHKGARQRGR
jgi:hypothetical protein